jgi:hypothetical protein
MDIVAQDLGNLIKEGSNLVETGLKMQDRQSIMWFLKSKTVLDRLGVQSETLDKFRFSLDFEERLQLLQKISGNQ